MMAASNCIGVGVATLYSEASAHSEWISQLGYGTKVEITKQEKDWTQVAVAGSAGWVESRSIIKMDSPLPEGIQGRITSIWAFVFLRDAETKKPYTGLKLPYGTSVRVPTPIKKLTDPGATGNFIVVSLVDGRIGVVRDSTIDLSGKPLALTEAIMESAILRHFPYVWGGTSSLDGFDCSGYVQTVFLQTRVFLPRNAIDQMTYEHANIIEKSEIAVGDLLFFKNIKNQYHVGICSGVNFFVHFTPETGRTVSFLDDPEWSKKFIGARRILK